jgi:hypothetical protein
MTTRRFGFGHCFSRIVLGVKHLPLQIALLDEIAVDQSELSDARPRQERCLYGPESAASNDHRRRSSKPLLAIGAERGESNLAAIPVFRHENREKREQIDALEVLAQS